MLIFITLFNIDVDECLEGTHECVQNCHNTIGSYACSCNIGFVIDVDERSCDGKNEINM